MTAMRDQRLSHSTVEYLFLDIALCLWVKLFRRWGGTIFLRNVGKNLPNYTRNIPEELNFHVGADFIQHQRRN
jgi:hypothetical protein